MGTEESDIEQALERAKHSIAFLKEAVVRLQKLKGSKRERLEDYMDELLSGESSLTYFMSVDDFLKRRW